MNLVVDANVIVSAFLRSVVTRELLIHDGLALRMPEHGRREVEKVLASAAIRKRLGGMTVDAVRRTLSLLTSRIRFESEIFYQRELRKAKSLVAHEEDAPYMALALTHRIGIWTNDFGFQDQTEVPIYATAQLAKALLRR